MYGIKQTSALSATGGVSLLSTSSALWLFFAVITALFAVQAVVQLVRRTPSHRP